MCSDNPLVSIVIPTYNRESVIGRAIKSVLNQSYKKTQIIVVDDGSTDETQRIVEQFDDPRLKYIHQKNSGANAARNTGIELAQGEFISFLDSDDVLLPTHISHAVNAILEASDQCVGAATGHVWYAPNSQIVSAVPDRELSVRDFSKNNPIGGFSTVTFKSSVREQVGLLDEELPSLQDYDYFLRATKQFTIVGISQVLVERHEDSENRISDSLERKKRGQDLIMEKHGDIITSYRISTHHIQIGKLLANDGMMQQARKEFISAVNAHPTNVSALFYLSASLGGTRWFNFCLHNKDKILYKIRCHSLFN